MDRSKAVLQQLSLITLHFYKNRDSKLEAKFRNSHKMNLNLIQLSRSELIIQRILTTVW
jgi:hypothetical protein